MANKNKRNYTHSLDFMTIWNASGMSLAGKWAKIDIKSIYFTLKLAPTLNHKLDKVSASFLWRTTTHGLFNSDQQFLMHTVRVYASVYLCARSVRSIAFRYMFDTTTIFLHFFFYYLRL